MFNEEEVVARIKIVNVPDGEAPFRAREELYGVTLLIVEGDAQSTEYVVTLNEVIAQLEEKESEQGNTAARLWDLHKPTRTAGQLVFKAGDCEFISETSCSDES